MKKFLEGELGVGGGVDGGVCLEVGIKLEILLQCKHFFSSKDILTLSEILDYFKKSFPKFSQKHVNLLYRGTTTS